MDGSEPTRYVELRTYVELGYSKTVGPDSGARQGLVIACCWVYFRDEMHRDDSDSRALRSFSYDPDGRILTVEFASGGVYEYLDVDASIVAWLEQTPHKGAYVNRVVKTRFAFRDVTPKPESQDLQALLEESLRR